MRLMLDTNVVLDFMLSREPYYHDVKKLMLLGYVKEAELWVSAAQINDLFYMLTKGGKPVLNNAAKESLRKLRECVHICRVGEKEVDAVLNSTWEDLEDACLHQVAIGLGVDYILSRDVDGFAHSAIKALNPTQFFAYLETEHCLTYHEIGFL